MLKYIGIVFLYISTVGCGVRGDPIPPGYPAELGRGRPEFRDPSQSMSYPPLPTSNEMDQRLQEDEKEDEE